MRALLATHAFLWWITDAPALPGRVRDIIRSSRNDLFVSAASGWEIAIKARLGRLHLQAAPEPFLLTQLALNAMEALPITMRPPYTSRPCPPCTAIPSIGCSSLKPTSSVCPSSPPTP